MRLIHLSDTHLGFSAYSKLDPVEGINQREADMYDAFRQAVDKAIELRPDAVLHAGDLFDTVRPQNRAIDFALRQLLRLSEAGIETVLISGNHSTPRLRETGSIFRIFEHLPHIHPVHEPGRHLVRIGDLAVTAVPHSVTPSMADVVAAAKPVKEVAWNVLLLHAGIADSYLYRMDEFNEQTVPLQSLRNGWDYVALGHFHSYSAVDRMMCYSGSTERLGFGEAGQKKGILEVDLDRGKVNFHELRTRDMLDLPPLDAAGLTSSEILREAKDLLSSSKIDDRIVRLIVKRIEPDALRSLDLGAFRRLGSSAMHFELKFERTEADLSRETGEAQIGLLADEYRKYVHSLNAPEDKKRKLLDIGLPYLMAEDEE